ncbi:hypothetical protein SY83_12130 [Paenibacillus swuensis]|uniref:Alpha-galactosidase n=1 Tax=Paenibacillus swuensis TaxID=1178515 RepID=A0A172TIN4_9BACL|nr:glycoside hydrolase family 36 protein [Paenibacillus swuensis]ANE46901.1 hypothetical protein SY83_12130 [Paenibacillus swuensis]
MRITLHENGCFDIRTDRIYMLQCYPGWDGESVHPVQTAVKGQTIVYTFPEGSLTLQFKETDDGVTLSTSLKDMSEFPQWVHPIYQGRVQGADGYFRQGFGMAGPSGYQSLSSLAGNNSAACSAESYGLTAFTHEHGCLVLFAEEHDTYMHRYDLQSSGSDLTMKLTCGFRTERTRLQPTSIPDIHILETPSLEEGLTGAARRMASRMQARTHQPPAYHWCSWYYKYYEFSQEDLTDYLQGFSATGTPLRYVQIDAGYFPSLGDWLEINHLWPDGLQAAFRRITEEGYTPGIWIGPFMVGNRSRLYREHPDWVLRKKDGTPVTELRCYGEFKLWGYKDEEYYVLDTSHPEAMAYLCQVFRTLYQWGARLFKTDFMFWGVQDSSEVSRHTPGKTSIGYFRDFLQAVRQEIGEESYWLGCIAPFHAFIGFADGMRIAGDLGPAWIGDGHGPVNMIRETMAVNYMNHIFWQNDPDAVILRDFHISLTDREIESLALLQAVSGGAVYTSDPLHEVNHDRLSLFRFIEPHGKQKPILPYLQQRGPEQVFVHRWPEEERYLIYLFNPTEFTVRGQYSIAELTGTERVFTRVWQTGEYTDQPLSQLIVSIAPHQCLLYFAKKNKVLNDPIDHLWVW